MRREPKRPAEDDAEQQLLLLHNLLAEKMHGDVSDKRRRRSTVREALLTRRHREAAAGNSSAAVLLLLEEQEFAPLRQRYLELQQQRTRPLSRYVYGRVMLVPPPLSCNTVSQWLEDGITEEQMLEMERLHAINDERCLLEASKSRSPPPAAARPEIHSIEQPWQIKPEERAMYEVVSGRADAISGGMPAAPEGQALEPGPAWWPPGKS